MKVSLLKIIKSDYITLLLILVPVVLIIFLIDAVSFNVLQSFLSNADTEEYIGPIWWLGMTIVAILICIPKVNKRIQEITDTFKYGFEVTGKIVHLSLYKDRGRIEYEYQVKGHSYKNGTAIHRNKFINSLKEGQNIALIVPPGDYTKALIKEMYIQET